MAHAKTLTKFRSCVVCGNILTDRAHFKTRGSGAGWLEHEFTYLCRKHHQEQHILGIYNFSQRYPSYKSELHAKGWEFIDYFGIMKLRRKDNA